MKYSIDNDGSIYESAEYKSINSESRDIPQIINKQDLDLYYPKYY